MATGWDGTTYNHDFLRYTLPVIHTSTKFTGEDLDDHIDGRTSADHELLERLDEESRSFHPRFAVIRRLCAMLAS